MEAPSHLPTTTLRPNNNFHRQDAVSLRHFRPKATDPNLSFGHRTRHITKQWMPSCPVSVEELTEPEAQVLKRKIDYEFYLCRIIKHARKQAVRNMIDGEAEDIDSESVKDTSEEEASASLEEYLERVEDSEDEEDSDGYNMETEGDDDGMMLELEDLFGPDWEYED